MPQWPGAWVGTRGGPLLSQTASGRNISLGGSLEKDLSEEAQFSNTAPDAAGGIGDPSTTCPLASRVDYRTTATDRTITVDDAGHRSRNSSDALTASDASSRRIGWNPKREKKSAAVSVRR